VKREDGADGGTSELLIELREVSFSIPQRKKLHFRVVGYGLADARRLGVQAVNPATGALEYELPGADIAHILRLPVPEKASKQYNYVLLTRSGSAFEPVVFTLPATPLKGGTYTFPPSKSTSETPLDDALNEVFGPHDLTLTLPDEKVFASAVPEPHRKSEKAYHVKAFRGSKDGFLFFLASGIFFGFKKPLLWLGTDEIESISYTSVLQRTFNLNIAFRKADGEVEEVEFSMLDQADYSGINDYVQSKELNDASLAAGRRAKSELKKKGGAAANGEGDGANGEEDDGRTELEKAEAQLQDEEDEDEEDFEPSDDDSDGSGSDDESDEEGYTEPKSKRDLVTDELGSEAEDVEISEDEDDVDEVEEDMTDADGHGADGELEVQQPVPRPAVIREQGLVQGRWGAAINKEPDPDDPDML
jgi:hypothetical protein